MLLPKTEMLPHCQPQIAFQTPPTQLGSLIGTWHRLYSTFNVVLPQCHFVTSSSLTCFATLTPCRGIDCCKVWHSTIIDATSCNTIIWSSRLYRSNSILLDPQGPSWSCAMLHIRAKCCVAVLSVRRNAFVHMTTTPSTITSFIIVVSPIIASTAGQRRSATHCLPAGLVRCHNHDHSWHASASRMQVLAACKSVAAFTTGMMAAMLCCVSMPMSCMPQHGPV
ncbi:hypothetical protein COO60DRAFT_1150109 [Scenedesmus sp. NREL 46B-D3]|nr:hypothetical protein COO60DRAFT_1150109 [Scenedesmus sp. NREL 46B-D3]